MTYIESELAFNPVCCFVTTVLDYIKNNVTKQCDQNQEAAKRIEGLLKDYEAKLKDLEAALDQAKLLVEKANTQNSLNTQAMQDLLVMNYSLNSSISEGGP